MVWGGYSFKNKRNGKFAVINSNKIVGAQGCCFLNDNTATVTCRSEIVYANSLFNPNNVIIFASDIVDECKSFMSWVDTKFVRFFILLNISKLDGVFSDYYFRFVPAPPSGKFDHIYTDEELYKAFNLPQKYIDVIEAVVKERK